MKAVVFDMDGVLFDTERLSISCWMETAQKMGLGDIREGAYGCIGHMRGYFEGEILHHDWWPHYWNDRRNDAAFRADLTRVVDWLRVGFAPLKNLEIMDAFCVRYSHAAILGQNQAYGFRVETKRYRYMLRCTPVKGTYNAYLYCYDKEAAR